MPEDDLAVMHIQGRVTPIDSGALPTVSGRIVQACTPSTCPAFLARILCKRAGRSYTQKEGVVSKAGVASARNYSAAMADYTTRSIPPNDCSSGDVRV